MNLATVELFKNIGNGVSGIRIEGELVQKCQKVMFSITEDFISMCEKEGIWYQLGGGSALGAVREHGFIPWDDDMDINVLSKDFDNLGSLVKKYYDGKYTFINHTTPGFNHVMGRIVLNNTLYCDRTSFNCEHKGFFLDIFIVENVPDNSLLRRLHGIFCMIFGGLLSCRNFYRDRNIYSKLAAQNPAASKIVKLKMFIGWCISFLPSGIWARLTRRIYGLCKNEHSKFVSIPSGRKHYFGEMYSRAGMIDTISCEFEGRQWKVAKDYDKYFTALYGPDYMTPPPPEKREHHLVFELKFPDSMTQEEQISHAQSHVQD